jgi:hypothetical protein
MCSQRASWNSLNAVGEMASVSRMASTKPVVIAPLTLLSGFIGLVS